MKLNHLDLFSGIGGFHLGFEKAGFEVNSYFSEIDKYAIDVYKYNFKNSTYVGSVTDVRATDLPKIDAITFGSPCQDFSLAGRRKGLGGDRSSLIAEAIRLIDECKPRFFIWENVKGTFSSNNGADFWAIIQAFTNIGGYRLEWQLLNTKWFLPQNRERIYLVGYLGNRSKGQVFPIQKINKKTNQLQRQQTNTNTLTARYRGDGNGSYIIERKLEAQETELKQIKIGTLRTHNDGKGFRKIKDDNCPAIPARAREDGSGQPIIKITSATKKGYEVARKGDSINYSVPTSKTRRGRVGKQVAQTLDTGCNQAVIAAMRGRNPKNPSDRTKGGPREQRIEINKHGTSNTLTSVYKDNLVLNNQAVIGYSRDSKGKVVSRHKINNANTIHKSSGGGGNTDQFVLNKSEIRRLTPIECERLQGFPDNWTKYGTQGEISDSQRYKMCGNAVTVDVVETVVKNIIKLKI
jgi:DNA (cytosine-5)-methyltransferase 1